LTMKQYLGIVGFTLIVLILFQLLHDHWLDVMMQQPIQMVKSNADSEAIARESRIFPRRVVSWLRLTLRDQITHT